MNGTSQNIRCWSSTWPAQLPISEQCLTQLTWPQVLSGNVTQEENLIQRLMLFAMFDFGRITPALNFENKIRKLIESETMSWLKAALRNHFCCHFTYQSSQTNCSPVACPHWVSYYQRIYGAYTQRCTHPPPNARVREQAGSGNPSIQHCSIFLSLMPMILFASKYQESHFLWILVQWPASFSQRLQKGKKMLKWSYNPLKGRCWNPISTVPDASTRFHCGCPPSCFRSQFSATIWPLDRYL